MPTATINQRIETIIRREKLNQNSFSVLIGHPFQQTRHIITGRNKPGYDYLFNVIKTFPHISIEWIMLGKGAYKKII